MRGTAFVFGDEINTDIIAPAGFETQNLVQNLMSPVRPEFTDKISKGDLIVAGEHFGSGSSRETAPQAIQEAGIAGVIAESFSRIYYRNSVNIGLPALPAPGVTDFVSEGDNLEVDMDHSIILNHTTDSKIKAEPVPDELASIYKAGGIFEFYQEGSGGLRNV